MQDLAEDLRQREAADVTSGPLPNDLPPKYDDLEQPPQYEEHHFRDDDEEEGQENQQRNQQQ